MFVFAEEANGINYSLTKNGDSYFPNTAAVSSKSGGYSGDVVIPEKEDVTSEEQKWGWQGMYNVTVTRNYKITSIAKDAFSGCSGLTSVTIPYTVIKVGDNAFANCSSLKHVYSNMLYPQSLGSGAFASVASDCVLHIPVGTLTAYRQAGWTKESTGITIVEEGEPQENYCLENPVTHNFVQNVVYPDDDYTFTRITDYISVPTTYRKDLPSPVRIIPPVVSSGKELVLETYADGQMVRSDRFVLESKVLEVWNLIPQKSYTYQLYVVNANDSRTKVSEGAFRTEGTERMLNIGYIYNFRDIGGWSLPGGKRIRYDRIFRTGELEISGRFKITDEGKNELLNVQNVGVEIDFGDYYGSPVQSNLEYVNGARDQDGSAYRIRQYLIAINNTGSNTHEQLKNCFEKIVNSLRAGKKVIFHCNLGADRTGTLAFLLEGLLGASESDMAKDYEMTSYTYDGRYRYVDPTGISDDLYKRDHSYWKLVKYVKDNFPGDTFMDKMEQLALSFNISQTDIDAYRTLMTEVVEVTLDEESTTAPVAAEHVKANVRRTIKADEWSTLCLPFAMTADQVKTAFGDDVRLAVFNDYVYDETNDVLSLGFVTATAIEANRPYVIRVTSPVSTFSVDDVTIDPQAVVVDFDNSSLHNKPRQMVGTYVANTTLDSGSLFLSNNQFWYSAGKTKMKGYRAYFNFHDRLASFSNAYSTSGSRINLTFDDVTTGVDNRRLGGASHDNNCYDLQGRRVAKPSRRGVYVSGGRKIVVTR